MTEREIRCRERILSDEYQDVITDYNPLIYYRDSSIQDFCYFELEDNIFIAHANRKEIVSEKIFYQYMPKCYGLMQDESSLSEDVQSLLPNRTNSGLTFNVQPLIDSGILAVNREPLNLTGQGVVIAFIDTGIRYDLDVFRNPDGSSRILAIWDQTIQSDYPPEGFVYGTEYTSEDINRALNSENPKEIVPSTDAGVIIRLNQEKPDNKPSKAGLEVSWFSPVFCIL